MLEPARRSDIDDLKQTIRRQTWVITTRVGAMVVIGYAIMITVLLI